MLKPERTIIDVQTASENSRNIYYVAKDYEYPID